MTPDRIETATLSTHEHLAFLERLAGDDALRDTLAADPVATLRLLGIEVDAGDLPSEIVLPPKDALGKALPAMALQPPASASLFGPIPWWGGAN